MRYILGIDAGNSKTIAMVADETGVVLGAGRSGSGSHQAVGLDDAMDAIRGAADDALTQAGLTRFDITGAYYALAGADLDIDFDILRPAITADPLAPQWELDNDVMAALRSGTDCDNAVAVVLGSGFNATGRNARGEAIRLAGLGWLSGDWGGGGEMAREAIRLSVRQWDGRGTPTMLHDVVLRVLDVPDIEQLILALHTRQIDEPQYLAIVPAIFEAAEAGDVAAVDLVRRSGVEAATTILALLRRLDLLKMEADVVLAGSVLRSQNALLIGTIEAALMGEAPAVHIIIPDVEPAVGAVLGAMDVAGLAVDGTVRKALARTSIEALRTAAEARL
jgi:N-acetylglucosamine kinase-like BadF-type ATPase